jgi:CHASE3 domain sensor protein
MKSLVIRLMLLAVCFIASGIAVYFVWTSETYTRQSAESVRAFDQAAHEAERAVLDVRAAQHAYVAAGQDAQAWIQKAAASVTIVKAQLDYLRAHAASQPAQNAIDNAASALQDFDQIDRRARDYVRNGQPLLASDAIFADGSESTSAIEGSVEAARAAEGAVHADEQAVTRRAEAVAIAAAAVVVLVTILLFAFSTTVRTHEADGESVADGDTRMMPMNGADWLRPGDGAATPVRTDAASEPAASSNINFGAVASVCGELARVMDTHALPPLLGRAAELLDAPGIVLWIADPDGRELSPIVTHGYSQSMVLRLGTILRDDENATAAALRTSLLQTVDTDAVSNGAIAAPLVTPTGCVGIMAAEVRHHGEKDPAKLAAASIIAAQLATLVGPPSTRAQARADAV